MDIIYNKIFLEHDTGMHPENCERLKSCGKIKETDISSGESYLELVHDPSYIKQVKEFCASGGRSLDADTIVSSKSYEAAIRAVGAVIQAAENQDFALVRPPGHHAHPDHASGFCLFNNIAIASEYLSQQGKKVLIIDFDGHLGDGTEAFFYSRQDVLYWSFHQYPAFPGWGTADQIGEGEGKGYTINVPLPADSGDDLFFKSFNALLPVAKQFSPDVVAVSAGFDAHQFDPLLSLCLSTGAYYKIGKILRANFGNIFATLEGGYNLEFLPKCIENFLSGINNQKIIHDDSETNSPPDVVGEFDKRIGLLYDNLSKYWKL